jgi:Bacterial Ig-like domain (group 3)
VQLILDVSSAAPTTAYQFVFGVQDPTTHVWISVPQNYTTLPTQQEFVIIVSYPSSSFNATGGVNSLVGIYPASVSQIKPVPKNNVASTFFRIGLTDNTVYQRTQTVSIKATGYQPYEFVNVRITTSPGSTVVLNNPDFADAFGVITDRWTIPPDADLSQTYIVTATGSTTSKSPADVDGFTITPAQMTISSLSSYRATYQRTQQVKISFQASYPSLAYATTGSANVTLVRPNSSAFNITASYDSVSQNFAAVYRLPINAPVGVWTARLNVNNFDDSYGNKGPQSQVSTTFTVQVATLSVTTTLAKTTFVINERIPLNMTMTYPDGTPLGASDHATGRLSLSGGTYVASVSLIYDTSTNQWEGLYIPTGNEPTGLWSLTVNGTDNTSPINTGVSSNVITLNKRATTVAVTCNPSQITVGQQVTCTATVTDVDVGTAITPTGQVTISPAFANPQLCDLPSGSGSSASCSAIFVTRAESQGANAITANYGGDSHEGLSSTTASVIIQQPPPTNTSGDNPFTLPLFYFAIIAGIIAAIVAVFMAFRHKTTHTKLKIDLEAVKSEAGKIENQAFFQSVKDQLTKDKDETGGGNSTAGQGP